MPSDQRSGPIAIVLGTRPEIIKLAKITELLGDAAFVVHTGQHFDRNLSASFFDEFGMRPPDTFIGIGGRNRGEQIGTATTALDELFRSLHPSAVVVQGDTNSVTAGALAANANDLPLVHVEAGLRSRDRRMPEEHNRVIADHLADLCLAPTEHNVENLRAEGITGDRVALTGNPVVEAVERLLPSPTDRSSLLESYGVSASGFVLSTLHRPENVDASEKLTVIVDALASLPFPTILPLHPRTRARASEFGIDLEAGALRVIDPIGYRDFIGLGAESLLLVSDSGGVQEEVSVYKKPAVVIRRSTERQEVEGTFVVRVEPDEKLTDFLAEIVERVPAWTERISDLPSPYGNGTSPSAAVDAIQELVR